MLTQKNQQNGPESRIRIKMAFIALVLALIVFIEPIFAAKNQNNRNSNRASQRRQQVQRSAPAPRPQTNSRRVQRQSTNNTRTTPRARSNIQTRSNIQRSTTRNNNRSTPQSSFRGLSKAPSNNRSTRQTTNNRSNTIKSPRTPASTPRNKTNVQRQTPRTIKTPAPRTTITNPKRNTPTNSNPRVNPNRNSQITGSNSKNTNITSKTRNQPTAQSPPRTERKSIFSSLFRNKRTASSRTTKQPTAIESRTSDINTRNKNRSSFSSIAKSINAQKTSDEKTNSRQSLINDGAITRQSRNERNTKTSTRNLFNRSNSRNNTAQSRSDLLKSRETRSSDIKANRNSKDSTNTARSPRSIRESSRTNKNETNNNSRTQTRANEKTANNTRERKESIQGLFNRTPANSRLSKDRSSDKATIQDRPRNTSNRINRDRLRRSAKSARVAYHDRPNLVRHSDHSVYTYRDRFSRLHYNTVRPRHRYIIGYRRGWRSAFRYIYPYYHRKYVFVSLGGWWPWDYSYVRYYWYGCHPYYWYGYYPIAREVDSDTYNYYTYNYYGVDDTASQPYQSSDYIEPVDENTFADVREKLAQQQDEVPTEPGLADLYFENAVKAFESGDYEDAIEKFEEAIQFAPEDQILPFAYCQAFMANGQYAEAAEVLRAALVSVDAENEGVFYPRGLYSNDETLFTHIDNLIESAELNTFNADLQLLLGYQLLGLGETEQATEPLLIAAQDPINAQAAAKLLQLQEKIKNSESQVQDSNTEIITPAKEVISKADSIRVAPSTGQVTNKMYTANIKETALLATLFTLATGSGAYHYFKS